MNFGDFGVIKPQQLYCGLRNSTGYFMVMALILSMMWTLIGFDIPVKESYRSNWFGSFVTATLSILLFLTLIFYITMLVNSDASAAQKIVNPTSFLFLLVIIAAILGIVNTTVNRPKRGDATGITTIILSAFAILLGRPLYQCWTTVRRS